LALSANRDLDSAGLVGEVDDLVLATPAHGDDALQHIRAGVNAKLENGSRHLNSFRGCRARAI
jgi:hypothetical protein